MARAKESSSAAFPQSDTQDHSAYHLRLQRGYESPFALRILVAVVEKDGDSALVELLDDPAMISAMIGLLIFGTKTATLSTLQLPSARATGSGTKFNSSTSSLILFRFFSVTVPGVLKYLETVATDTPARSAIVLMVIGFPLVFTMPAPLVSTFTHRRN